MLTTLRSKIHKNLKQLEIFSNNIAIRRQRVIKSAALLFRAAI